MFTRIYTSMVTSSKSVKLDALKKIKHVDVPTNVLTLFCSTYMYDQDINSFRKMNKTNSDNKHKAYDDSGCYIKLV